MIVRERFPLSEILYYRIGGSARYLLEARSRLDVGEALEFVHRHAIARLVVVGQGSNLLFPDGEFDGAVLHLAPAAGDGTREVGENLVESFAGESLDSVILFGFQQGYVGLQWAGGLPGTVGAAVRGNVGAFGGELKDVLAAADVLELTDVGAESRRLTNAELAFAYRESRVKRNRRMIVTAAVFALDRASTEDELAAARESYHANIRYRETHHPMDYPTCGSTFKNISRGDQVAKVLEVWPDLRQLVDTRWYGKVSVGYAIDRLGLTGYQVGGAQVSPKHSNFIVNLGNARFSDVRGIIQTVQARFEQTFGFTPEPEVEIVGEDL